MSKTFHRMLSFLAVLTVLSGCHGAGSASAEESRISTDYGRYRGKYGVVEYLDDSAYDLYMSDQGELFGKLLLFRDELVSSPAFDYYSCANNQIEVIETEIPDECLCNYGTKYVNESRFVYEGERLSAAEAIQVSDGYLNLFPVDMSEGRSFEKADYQYPKTGVVPVILGSAYRPVFDVGDTFEAYYILERFTFEVIGFAQPGNAFFLRSQNRMDSLDRYLIMPFAKIEVDSIFGRRVLLQEMNGFIAPHGRLEDTSEKYYDCLKNAGLEEWMEFFGINRRDVYSIIAPPSY